MYIEEATTMISRRDFLKSAGAATLAVAAAGILAGCSTPSNEPAPAPSEPETPATGNTFELAKGLTLTILGTTRANVLPNGTKQYLAVKFKLSNNTGKDLPVDAFTTKNFKSNLNGTWEFPIADKDLSDSQKKFLLNTADAPWMGYYEYDDAVGGNRGTGWGLNGTDLEAAICYMTDTSKTSMDLYITYGSKVFKTTLSI